MPRGSLGLSPAGLQEFRVEAILLGVGTAGPTEDGCRDIAAIFPGVQPRHLHTCHFTPGVQLGFLDSDARAAPLHKFWVSLVGTRRKTCDLKARINHRSEVHVGS